MDNIFNTAANLVQQNSDALSESLLLKLYGYYKVATVGPCNESQPSIFNRKARVKWNAWMEASSLAPKEAMREYVNIVKGSGIWEDLIDQDTSVKGVASQGFGNAVSTLVTPTEDDNDDEDNILFSLAKDGLTEKMKEHLNETSVDLRDKNGLSALHWAVDRGHLHACKLLLENGANPVAEDCDGSTPLEYAETCEHKEIANLLRSHIK